VIRHQVGTVFEILIIEDSKLLREMLTDVLSSLDDVAVVAEAENEEKGLELAESHRPDLVIVDLELAAGSGIGVLAALHRDGEKYGNPKAVVFTNHGSGILRRRCENLGIDAFFDKSYQLDDLIDFILSARDVRAL
jgi:DNA-binding NarL/FixJ family response regulator